MGQMDFDFEKAMKYQDGFIAKLHALLYNLPAARCTLTTLVSEVFLADASGIRYELPLLPHSAASAMTSRIFLPILDRRGGDLK
jgi:hypothetical protein